MIVYIWCWWRAKRGPGVAEDQVISAEVRPDDFGIVRGGCRDDLFRQGGFRVRKNRHMWGLRLMLGRHAIDWSERLYDARLPAENQEIAGQGGAAPAMVTGVRPSSAPVARSSTVSVDASSVT